MTYTNSECAKMLVLISQFIDSVGIIQIKIDKLLQVIFKIHHIIFAFTASLMTRHWKAIGYVLLLLIIKTFCYKKMFSHIDTAISSAFSPAINRSQIKVLCPKIPQRLPAPFYRSILLFQELSDFFNHTSSLQE